MSRKLFRKALNHIESRSCDSNISRLNDELKKTGMLSERMTTSTVLPPTETQPFIPPTSSPAPLGDLSDLNTFAWDNAAQGNGSSISHDFSQLATTDVNGETKSILEIPSISTTDGTGFTGTVYGLAFGPNTAVSGNPLGYINENGFNHVYQYQNVFSVTHTEFSRALVDYYEDNAFTSKVIYLWGPLLYRVTQPIQPAAFYPSGSDFNSQPRAERGLYGYTLLIPVDSNGNIKRNNIITDLGQSRTIVLNRLDDPSAPDYHEGDFTRYLKNLLDLSGQAFDYLDQKALETEKLIAGYGLRPDGTQGLNHPGDVNRGHDGTLYKLVPRPGYGYNMWVPLKKASAGEDEIALDTVPYEPPSPGPGGYKRPGSYDPSKFFDIPTNHGPQFPSPNLPQTGPGRSSVPDKKKQSVVAHHELEGEVLSEGWQSPDHTNVEKDSKTRWFNPNAGTDSAKWFDPKEVKPAYPTKAPPKMIDGYSATSNLAPKPVEKSPAIKLTKKDLLRNHKLKDSEVAGMMQTIARLNKFIADHPEELIYAKSRYPKHDPRLAELNWNMDQMLKASGDYLDKQFPENERLFARIQNSIIKNIKATDPEEYKEVISTIETEKKARKIKKSHLSRKVSERERKSAFSRALKHLPTEARVQSDVTKERIEEIAKAELEYLKTIGKPKYYDWKDDGFDFSENFEDRKKSIRHFHSLIDKRIENLENALEEGMTTSEYIKQLYGEIPTITSIMSIDPNLLGSKFAQDVVQDSEKATTHAYGSYFPGSYVNSIGDFNPQSYSKVDAQAHLAHASANKAAAAPHDEDHVFAYQATDYVLPTAQQMTTNMTTVSSGDFFSDQMKQMIWPTYGQVSPIPGPDPNEPGYDLDQYSYPWNHHVYPDNAYFEGLGYNMSNLTDEQQRRVIRERVSFIGGKYGGVSGTYQDDNHFLDLTYGTARSIDETSFDIVNGAFVGMDDFDVYPEFESLGLGPSWGWRYDIKNPRYPDDHYLNDDRDLTKEHWQYQENSEEFKPSHLEDIIGVTFPAVKVEKYNVGTSEEPEIEQWYSQPGGFHYDMEDGDLPGDNDVNWAGAYDECSAHKKIIQNARPGDVITFDYRIATDQWDNTSGYPLNGDDYGEGPYSGHSDELNELYVIAGKRIMKVWSLYRELPDDECTEDYGFVLRNTESPIDTGTFSYVIQESDINPITGALDFVTSYHADDFYVSRLSVTNFAINDGKEFGSGKLGKTTAAYDLGAPVAALATDKGKKKKGEGDDEEEVFKSETTELSDEDKELQVKEKQRLDDIAAAEAAEEKRRQALIDKAKEQTYTYKQSKSDTGLDTWKGELEGLSGIKIADRTLDQDNPTSIPNGFFGGAEFITSLEQYDSQPPDGIPLFIGPVDGLNYDKFLEGFTTPQIKADGSQGFERNKLTPWHTYIASRETQYMRENPEYGRPKLEAMLRHPVYRADFLARTSPEFREWINSIPNVETGNGWLGKYTRPNLFPPGRAGFVGQFGGWWLPGNDSHEEVVEAVKRAYTLFGSYSGQWGLALVEDPADDGTSVNDNPYAIEDPIFKDDEDVDPEMQDLLEILERLKKDPFSLTAEDLRILKKYGYGDEVSEINELRKLVEDSGIDWSSILKALVDAANVGLDVAAIIGLLFPEPGSSAAGLARLIPKLKKLRALMRSAKSWWNKGRNKRIANENEAQFGKFSDAVAKDPDKTDKRSLFGDDRRQRGQSDDAFDAGEKSSPIGRPDRAVLGVDLDPRSPNFGRRVKADRGGPGSSPTPLIRQTFERPVRSVRDNPKGGIAARSISRTVDESFAPKNNKNILGDIDNTIDIFIELLYMTKLSNNQVNKIIQKFEKYAIDSNLDKNAYRDFSDNITRENNSEQIRKNKLKNKFISNNNLQKPNPNALYPGQPSPNGFPDTPPPNLAPNGYHPEYGKKADRYRKLDPVSAVMMRKVGTDDPQINKQVSDAARKPK